MTKRVHLLTESAVEKAKPAEARREIPDGGGLYLVLHPTGAKTWAVRYRRDGRPRKYTLPGPYPVIGLKAARRLARAALESVVHGGDPAAEKIHARRTAADSRTDFEAVAAEFLSRYLTKQKQRPRPRTLEGVAHLLGMVRDGDGWAPRKGAIADKWRGKKVTEITKGHVIDHLDALVERGITTNANRARAALHLFFGWCLRRGLVATNPCTGIDRPVAETARERVLTDYELGLFWNAAGEDQLFGPMYRLLALTGARRNEVRGMAWSEIDLDAATWLIPAGRAKNNRSHLVPLSAPAVALLKAQPRVARSKLVFTTTGETVLGGLGRAKERMDERMLAAARKHNPKANLEPWVLHDLRRTLATGLQKLGTPLPVIEKVLNHASGSFAGIVGIYQRHEFEEEKRAALDAWARHIQAITGEITGNVVEMRAAR